MSLPLDFLRTMLRIRRLEEAVVRLAEDPGRPIRGHVHVYIGQEAAGTGACAALEAGDYVFTTHRNHGHVLARGGEPGRILAEILGRVDGYSQGRAGGFHVAAPHLGILHTSAIVGGSIPLAAGAAFAASRLGNSKVALVFFGDGAMEEGVFSETLNIAQLWRLPVVFFMENNSVSPLERNGRGSPTSEHSAGVLADIPRAYGLTTEVVDGTDVDQVYALVQHAVAHTRRQQGPFFIESRTSRWPGTYASSPTLAQTGETDITWALAPDNAPQPVRQWVELSDPRCCTRVGCCIRARWTRLRLSPWMNRCVPKWPTQSISRCAAPSRPRTPRVSSSWRPGSARYATRAALCRGAGRGHRRDHGEHPRATLFAQRIVWPPIAELAYCGIAIGAAMAGLRPIVDLSTATFSYEAIPQIVNEAAVAYANSAGQTTVPVVFHMLYGLRGGGAAQHSGSPQSWYWNTPGLQVALPGSPADVNGLLRWAALKSQSPIVFLSHQRLFGVRGRVPDGAFELPFGQAEIKAHQTRQHNTRPGAVRADVGRGDHPNYRKNR